MSNLFRKLFPDKEVREYRKMHRRHRKELVKLAKETAEYDWCWLHQSVIMQVRHMYEYYSAGNNVWQVDESRLKVADQLQRILDMEEEINRLEDDHLGSELVMKDGEIKLVCPDDYREKSDAKEKRILELYQEIYSSIGRDIHWWWD